MKFEDELKKLTVYMPIEKLHEAVLLPKKFLPEVVTHIVPSFVIGIDGITLKNILLVTENYLCDINFSHPGETFDYIAKNTIKNYRFKILTHTIKIGDEVKATYELAEVALKHDLASANPGTARTVLTFAGNKEERSLWVEQLVKAIPIESVFSE